MKKIKLSGKYSHLETMVDDIDFIWLSKLNWHGKPGRNRKVYVQTTKNLGRVNNKSRYTSFAMHRLIINPDSKLHIDHINGDPLDNRRCNLRIATIGQNARNRGIQKNNKCGYKGVHKSKSNRGTKISWRAQIQVDGKLLHLGCFSSKKQASEAYVLAAKKYHGEFSHA